MAGYDRIYIYLIQSINNSYRKYKINEYLMCVFIFDKDTAELLAQFFRLKQTKISRLRSAGLNRFRGKFLKPFKNRAQDNGFTIIFYFFVE